ncbi:hypothetical protein MJO28_014882 [Puccinia striiformis f. sp. tritici]|uniref:Uncharacterized protein n=1 Tax=Puccinia striiformis f. sp. tritici TaxID=168172 RepID=A0ACC0DR75_9BASI|nr:hypothetical protein MJO28_014882 [Puccinia striiformis f. sp. tritici]
MQDRLKKWNDYTEVASLGTLDIAKRTQEKFTANVVKEMQNFPTGPPANLQKAATDMANSTKFINLRSSIRVLLALEASGPTEVLDAETVQERPDVLARAAAIQSNMCGKRSRKSRKRRHQVQEALEDGSDEEEKESSDDTALDSDHGKEEAERQLGESPYILNSCSVAR